MTHDAVLIAKWKIPVELKDCQFIHSLFEQASGGLNKPTRFIKSKKKPENANYYLDRFNRDVPLWYDENSSTLYYYIDEGKALGLYCDSPSNSMFSYMSSLEYIDTSDFDTSNVKTMSSMFWDCCSLTELDLSSFDTESVTDMYQMFLGCTSLTELDLSYFDTSNVCDMGYLFCFCFSLIKLDITSFDTSKVSNMKAMFTSCFSISEFNLSSFNTKQVVYMDMLFDGCTSLSKIITSEKFLTDNVEVSDDMFRECKSLLGGKGTTYDSKKIDKEYARIDKGTDSPGYFTAVE